MRIVRLFRSRDIVLRLQSKKNGLLQSAFLLLLASLAADLFPLGVMAATSFIGLVVRLLFQSMVAIVLVTWMWIVWNVLTDSLRKRKASSDFKVVSTVLILTIAVILFLNALPHPNRSGGFSFGWPFRFIYGATIISPFSAMLDLAHALIVIAMLLAVADRAKTSPVAPTETPRSPS